MPVTPNKYRIKDLPAITQEADLINKYLEVESGAADENSKVSMPTLVQTVHNNAPGANDSKSGYKMVRCDSPLNPFYNQGDATMTELNPDFLCLGTVCKAEFPGKEYILDYSELGPLNVWLDGRFAGIKIGAKWVEKGSLDERVKNISDFAPYTAQYEQGEIVKYIVAGALRLFDARQDLVKSSFSNNQIPAPTGLADDANWREINPEGHTNIKDYRPGVYKKDDMVAFRSRLYRAKRDLGRTLEISIGSPVFVDDLIELPEADWELFGGGGAGAIYDDTEVQARLASVEADLSALATTVESNKLQLDSRIDNLTRKLLDWAPGSYEKNQDVVSSGKLFRARQNIQNSTAAPTVTNQFWELIGGNGTVVSGKAFDYVLFVDFVRDANNQYIPFTFTKDVVYYDTYMFLFYRCLQTFTTTTEYPSTPDSDKFLQLDVASTDTTDALAARLDALTTNGSLTDDRRPFFAASLRGVVYIPTSTATNTIHAAAASIGQHGWIRIQSTTDSTAVINLQPGQSILGNEFFFRLGGFNLNIGQQNIIKDLKIENYGAAAYVRSTYGANNYQTPRLDGCTIHTPVRVEAGCFLRVVDCAINNATNWNQGDGTIILEGSTRSYFGAFSVGPGFATILDLRGETDVASKDYVDLGDAALQAQIDALETSGASGIETVTRDGNELVINYQGTSPDERISLLGQIEYLTYPEFMARVGAGTLTPGAHYSVQGVSKYTDASKTQLVYEGTEVAFTALSNVYVSRYGTELGDGIPFAKVDVYLSDGGNGGLFITPPEGAGGGGSYDDTAVLNQLADHNTRLINLQNEVEGVYDEYLGMNAAYTTLSITVQQQGNRIVALEGTAGGAASTTEYQAANDGTARFNDLVLRAPGTFSVSKQVNGTTFTAQVINADTYAAIAPQRTTAADITADLTAAFAGGATTVILRVLPGRTDTTRMSYLLFKIS